MRRRHDDYDEDVHTDYEEKQTDPVLRKLKWLIVLFIPQCIFFAWGIIASIAQIFGGTIQIFG